VVLAKSRYVALPFPSLSLSLSSVLTRSFSRRIDRKSCKENKHFSHINFMSNINEILMCPLPSISHLPHPPPSLRSRHQLTTPSFLITKTCYVYLKFIFLSCLILSSYLTRSLVALKTCLVINEPMLKIVYRSFVDLSNMSVSLDVCFIFEITMITTKSTLLIKVEQINKRQEENDCNRSCYCLCRS
jgi:hypothetical protein